MSKYGYGGGIGEYLGAGVDGYYRGRQQRRRAEEYDENADWRTKQRDRISRLQDEYDPIELEEALLGIKQRRRQDEIGDVSQEPRINAIRRGEAFDSKAHGINMRGLDYTDRSRRRADELGEASHPGDLLGIQYRDRRSRREDEIGGARHGVAMKSIPLAGDVTNRQYNDYLSDSDRDANIQLSYEAGQRALAIFGNTGDPKALMDWYNDDRYWPDGKQVNIEPLPISKAGDEKKFRVTFEGQTAEVPMQDLSSFVRSEMLNPQVIANAHGVMPQPQGMGIRNEKSVAAITETDRTFKSLSYARYGKEIPLNSKEGANLWLEAYRMQKATGMKTAEQAYQEYVTDAAKQLMESGMYSEKEAVEMSIKSANLLFGSRGGEFEAPDPEAAESGGRDIIAEVLGKI